MVSRTLSYAIQLAGRVDPSVADAFGRVNREVMGTEAALTETRQEQARLQLEMRGVSRGTPEYRRLAAQIEDAGERTEELNREQAELQREIRGVRAGSREYERLQTAIKENRDEARRLETEVERVNRELRGARRGTEEYARLERQLRDSRIEADRLNDSLSEQNTRVKAVNQGIERLGQVATVSAAAVGGVFVGLIAQVETLGPKFSQLLLTSRETGIEIEQIQRIQLAAAATGFDLDAEEFRELNIRLGEARSETLRALQEGRDITTASIGAGGEALRDLGLDATQITGRDLPLILDRLEQVDQQRRQFYADEIFGGALGERLLPILNLPPELREQIDGISVASEETAKQFQAASVHTLAFRRAAGTTAATLGTSLLPALTSSLDAVRPLLEGFRDFASENPRVLQGAVALGAAIATVATATWAVTQATAAFTTVATVARTVTAALNAALAAQAVRLAAVNAALAIRAALSGPVGWAALGVAAVTAAGIGYGAYRLAQDDDREDTGRRQRVERDASRGQSSYEARIQAQSRPEVRAQEPGPVDVRPSYRAAPGQPVDVRPELRATQPAPVDVRPDVRMQQPGAIEVRPEVRAAPVELEADIRAAPVNPDWQPAPIRERAAAAVGVEREELGQILGLAVERGAYKGSRDADELSAREQQETLRNILPTCPEEGVADAVREGLGGLMLPGEEPPPPPRTPPPLIVPAIGSPAFEPDIPTPTRRGEEQRPLLLPNQQAEILLGDSITGQRFRGEVPGERPRDAASFPDFEVLRADLTQETRRLRGLSSTVQGDVNSAIKDLAAEIESARLDLELDPRDRGALQRVETLTDASTQVTIQEINVAKGDPDEFVGELRAALETARLGQ